MIWSGSAGESHPRAPTDPYVNLSNHTAPASDFHETSQSQTDAESNPALPPLTCRKSFGRINTEPSIPTRGSVAFGTRNNGAAKGWPRDS
jgi:hypothetical protein